jgi:hypothetical protein
MLSESERKKALKRQWVEQQRANARASLPLDTTGMRALFDWLSKMLPELGCDRTRRLTVAWLQEQGHPVDRVLAWLDKNGGYCDCEVLANAEASFEFAAKPSAGCFVKE